MTTIASIQGENWAVIGYDARVVEGSDKIYTLPKDNGKLAKNGNYLLGTAGDMRAINLLTHVFKPPVVSPTTYGAKLNKFMSASFIPEMKKCFEDSSYGKDGEQGSLVIVLINGTVYEIGNDFSWAHDESGVYSVGTGSGYALGAILASLETKKRTLATAKSTIRQALTIASRLDPNTGGTIYISVQHYGN